MDAPGLRVVQHLDLLRQRGQLRRFKGELELDGVVLQLAERALEQELPPVHHAHVVANVLKLAQVVRRDEHRCAALADVLQNKAPHLAAHHGVKAVHRLVEDEIVRHRAQREPEGRLLLLALAHAAQRPPVVERKHPAQLFVALHAEARVDPAVKAHHIAQPRLHKVEPVVGDGGDAPLYLRVFPDGRAVKAHAARVLAVNARQMAQQRRLARAVRADQTVDRSPGDRQVRAVERGKAVKGLNKTAYFDHFSSSSLQSSRSSSPLAPMARSSCKSSLTCSSSALRRLSSRSR